MFIPLAPLPSAKLFINALKSKQTAAPGHKFHVHRHHRILFYPRGAFALAEALKMASGGNEGGTCFFPGYFCNQSLVPLRRAGAKIIFYRIRDNFEPDWNDVYTLAKEKKPDLFVLVHYFGKTNDTAEALVFCRKHGSLLFEDAAHLLQPTRGMAINESMQMYSPHKLLALPPISLLSLSAEIPLSGTVHNPVGMRREDFFWVMKRIIQKFTVALSWNAFWHTRPYYRPEKNPYSIKSIAENNRVATGRVSRFGLMGLQVFENEFNKIRAARVSNYHYLTQCLKEMHARHNILLWTQWSQEQTPYLFPVRLPENIMNKVMNRLHAKHIPAQDWPDLPPEIMVSADRHKKASALSKTLLFLPVHQSLNRRHLEYIGHGLLNALKESL